jgi:hypothetical protein
MPDRPAATERERTGWRSWIGRVTWLPWMLRVTWIAVAAVGWPALSSAVNGRSDAVENLATAGAVVVWVAGVVAMAVPATVSLTAVRVIVPVAPVAGLATLVGGGDTADAVETMIVSSLATLIAMSGELGKLFVQASAYGDEERHPLRPPFGFAIAAVLAWVVWAGAVVTGPLLLAARAWIPGAIVTALAVVATATLPRRWHQLSRRWLVLVPAGLALHDPIVLGETLMLHRKEIARIRLAPADTAAADLTGPTTGNAIEVATAVQATALLAPTRQQPRGRAVHLTAFLASPTRPGRALLAAAKLRLPVG